MKRVLLASCVALVGCIDDPAALPVHFNKLKAVEPQAEKDGLVVAVEPIAAADWREHSEIVARVAWKELDRNAPLPIGSGSGKGGIADQRANAGASNPAPWPPPLVLRTGEVPLLPLPAVLIELRNFSGHELTVGDGVVTLEDDQCHSFPMLAPGEVVGRVEADLYETHPVLGEQPNRDLVDNLAAAVARLPLFGPKVRVPDKAVWLGYATFHIEMDDVDEYVRFMQTVRLLVVRVHGLRLDGVPLADLTFPMVVERRKRR